VVLMIITTQLSLPVGHDWRISITTVRTDTKADSVDLCRCED
jgi:hypothetical protein